MYNLSLATMPADDSLTDRIGHVQRRTVMQSLSTASELYYSCNEMKVH